MGKTEHRDKKTLVWALLYVFCTMLVTGCTTTRVVKLPPPPPKYVYPEENEKIPTSLNSLWKDTPSLFGDKKAWKLNDLVTIKINETVSGSKTAETRTKKDSSIDMGVDSFLGSSLDFGATSPEIKGSTKSDFEGGGETKREEKLTGTITAKVVEVLPNNNLILEARKETTINNEKQILIIRGMVRPEDIDASNTVSSNRLADTEIYLVGDGVIQDKQSPGWLIRILDKAWPF